MSDRNRRREISNLIRTVRAKGADGIFDETVRQAKLGEAAAVNSRGLKRQIEYLIGELGLDRLKQILGSLMEHQTDVLVLAAEASGQGHLEVLQRAIYSYKQQEAAELASGSAVEQADYLTEKLGGPENVRRLLLHPQEFHHERNQNTGSRNGRAC